MENLALIDSFSEFKDDKLIDRVTLMAILEDVFRNALKKKNTVQMIILTSS
jgi:N utilization substance protein A